MIQFLYPILLTVTLNDGSTNYIAAKTQVAGLDLALKSWPDSIKRIKISFAHN